MDGKLQIPGGHTETGESPLAAILREANEELGIEISSHDVRHIATVAVHNEGNEYFALQFQLINPDVFDFRIMEPQKCSELVWADIAKLPEDTIDLFKRIVKESLVNDQTYTQIGY
jgi:8-oxo-dGTP pyrophosphatase MutT (NUDIX family)